MADVKREDQDIKNITVSNETGSITLRYLNGQPFGVTVEQAGAHKLTLNFNEEFFDLLEYVVAVHKSRFSDDD